jgi:hypothetical protein
MQRICELPSCGKSFRKESGRSGRFCCREHAQEAAGSPILVGGVSFSRGEVAAALSISRYTLRSRLNSHGGDASKLFDPPKKGRRKGAPRARLLTYDGVTLNMTEWATQLGMTAANLCALLRKGRTLESIVQRRRARPIEIERDFESEPEPFI